MWTTCCGGEGGGGDCHMTRLVVRVTKKLGSVKVKGFLTGHESETGAYRLNGWS